MLMEQQLGQEKISRQTAENQRDDSQTEVRNLTDQLMQVKMELERATTQLAAERQQNSREAELRREQFQEQLKTVQEQFSTLAAKVLAQTQSDLKTANSESMESLTKPLKENLDQLHKAIQSTNSETARNTASLSEQLKSMREQTQKIDETATRLTSVIRGQNKAQGNWGERTLNFLLDAQGFKRGVDYDVQETVTDDESGRRLIPDVILHYPNNEDVVIDSKMSIDAYYQYVSTDDEAMKRKYADDLVRSIRTQANGLAKKDYSHYIRPPRHAIDFVIMFVPNEGALQLALSRDPRLWAEAFDKQVFITSQQNLFAILRMIQIAWRQYAQTESQRKVFGLAEEMLKRVGEFIKRFDKVGKDIESLHKDYASAYEKAHTGRQSIVQKANELKQLGVKESANQPIPEATADLLEDDDVADEER